DHYIQSAAIGCASMSPILFTEAAFHSRQLASLGDFVQHVARLVANHKDPNLSAELIALLARQPAESDALKQDVLETLGSRLGADVIVPWNASLQSSFSSLLKSSRPGVAGAALPLIARWDTQGALSAEVKPLVAQLRARLNDSGLSDDERASVILNL